MDTTDQNTLPPAFEEIIISNRRASVLPVAFDSVLNRQLEDVGTHAISTILPNAHPNVIDEELPRYGEGEEDTVGDLPLYEERHMLSPVVSYNIYQINRKLQILTPATRSAFDRPRYRITTRSGPSLLSKKADFTLTRLPTGTAAAAESTPGKEVGFMNFDRSGQIPWQPRANVKVVTGETDFSSSSSSSTGVSSHSASFRSFDMAAPSFADWRITIDEQLYYWRLTDKPTALSFLEMSSNSVVARLVYSRQGTDATRGAELGVVEIFGGSRNEDIERIELVLSTVQIPLNHWKNMGRHYRNDVTPRNCGVAGPLVLGNSFFSNDPRTETRRESTAGSAWRRASNAV